MRYALLTLSLLLAVSPAVSDVMLFGARPAAGYSCSSAPGTSSGLKLMFTFENTAQTGNNNDYTAAEYDGTNYVHTDFTSTTLNEITFNSADTLDWVDDGSGNIVARSTKNTTSGKAGRFDMDNSADDIPTSGEVSFRIKYTATAAGAGSNNIVGTSATYGSGADLFIELTPSNKIQCCLSGTCVVTTSTVSVGSTYRFTCLYKEAGANDEIYVYLDGTQEASSTSASFTFDDTGPLVFMSDGGFPSGTHGFGGELDNFVWTDNSTHFDWKTHFDNGCDDYSVWD